MNRILQPVKIKIFYAENIQKITGVKSEETVISDNLTFMWLLQFVFSSHPKLEQKYPPGALGFSINGKPPKISTLLRAGDSVYFEGRL